MLGSQLLVSPKSEILQVIQIQGFQLLVTLGFRLQVNRMDQRQDFPQENHLLLQLVFHLVGELNSLLLFVTKELEKVSSLQQVAPQLQVFKLSLQWVCLAL